MSDSQENQKREFYLSVFTPETDLEQIMTSVTEKFGMEWNGKNSLLVETKEQRIEIQVLCDFMGEKFEKYIQGQKNGVCQTMLSFNVRGVDDIKGNLLHYIRKTHTYIMINILEKEEADNEESFQAAVNGVMRIFEDTLKEIGGVLCTANGSVFWNENGKVILAYDGECEVDRYFPFDYEESPEFLSKCTERQMARRNKNMKYLFEKDIFVCELPLNNDDEETVIRTPGEIVERMMGTLFISLYSEAMLNPTENMSPQEAKEFVQKVAKNFNIDNIEEVLTENEITYLNNENATEEEKIDYSWHYEHLYALEWALGLAEWNYPEDICDVGGCVRLLNEYDSMDEILQKCNIRSKEEILDIADLIYRMDWAAVDARINGLTGPMNLEHGVIQARHKTLNWLIRFDDADWDDVSTPT